MRNSKKKVLLIEDDGMLRTLYTDLLEAEGLEVEQAVEGNEGMKRASEGGYDLILLDILLPGMQGQEILKKLREKPPIQPNGPIVMLTNQSQKEVLDECRELGAAGEIIKSETEQDQFIQLIHKYLDSQTGKRPET
ncbi:response regulator [Patescibacteria group bacterium]|nr:response regulator [Patescibacteria group bacterium]